jgi:metal-responsive CopG/Arc/MetJ family transcriptional regulator
VKTAISIPDDVFRQAEAVARRSGVSRSQLVSDALREYLARHAPDEVRESFDRVLADVGEGEDDRFRRVAARRRLKRSTW